MVTSTLLFTEYGNLFFWTHQGIEAHDPGEHPCRSLDGFTTAQLSAAKNHRQAVVVLFTSQDLAAARPWREGAMVKSYSAVGIGLKVIVFGAQYISLAPWYDGLSEQFPKVYKYPRSHRPSIIINILITVVSALNFHSFTFIHYSTSSCQ